MTQPQLIDHLFRHQYGKMVSILTRIFGLSQLDMIEDAVQDTFVKAMLCWRTGQPDNPEAWLTQAARNRVIDLFRKMKAEEQRLPKIAPGPAVMTLRELFLDAEIADSQLRMIFTACHPALKPKDQIAFALKTISGFSIKEIASALLLKEQTVKKSLSRARKVIQSREISFEIPQGQDLPVRLNRVLEVLYLLFNEGFHSGQKEILIRKELCGEALRLSKMLLQNPFTNRPAAYALFALMCFHSARLDSKVNPDHELIDLKRQDRSQWHFPLIALGNTAMHKAVETNTFSSYHYEAAIAAEHLKAATFAATDWDQILRWYQKLYDLQPSAVHLLNMAIVQLQRGEYESAHQLLQKISPGDLEQRAYLYYGSFAEYFTRCGQPAKALQNINTALQLVRNEAEKQFLLKKKLNLLA